MSTSLLSNKMQKMILYYYMDLFENYERKTTPEICNDLGICENTLSKFLHVYCPTEESQITKVGLIILLSTKFGANSSFKELQKKYSDVIEKREMKRIIKEKIRINNYIVEQRNKTK